MEMILNWIESIFNQMISIIAFHSQFPKTHAKFFRFFAFRSSEIVEFGEDVAVSVLQPVEHDSFGALAETLPSSEPAESGPVRFAEPVLRILWAGENLNPRENGEEALHLVRVLLEEGSRIGVPIGIKSALGLVHDDNDNDDAVSVVRDGGADRGVFNEPARGSANVRGLQRGAHDPEGV